MDLVFFTGSREVGRDVARRAADRVVPAILELGGKSPMIVLADADVPRAARAAVRGAFANAGQVCIRPERVLVHRAVVNRFTELVADATRALRQGRPGGSAQVDVGPVVEQSHLRLLDSQIADALARGARVVAGGGRRPDLGANFFAPTVLAGCTPEMAIMNDETFGPLLPIMTVDDAEHALRVANDPPGGLSGSVWSRDVTVARELAARLNIGSAAINDVLVNYLCVEAPLGGCAGSGLGFRHGPEALRQFCRVETIVEDRPMLGWLSALVARHAGFPYDPRALRVIQWVLRRFY